MKQYILDKYTMLIDSTCFGDEERFAFQTFEGKIEVSSDRRLAFLKDKTIAEAAKWCESREEKERLMKKQMEKRAAILAEQQNDVFSTKQIKEKNRMEKIYGDKELRDYPW